MISSWVAVILAFLGVVNCGDLFDYNDTKIQGVALGGWLVLEPYISPSLFDTVGNLSGEVPLDESHLGGILQEYDEIELLEEHWDTFINETDFLLISDYGLNLVRIPIGYWAFEKLPNDTYIDGQEEYLDKLLEWAEKYDLKVWIDLHGVPGSQNGFDNSGLRNYVDWQKSENYTTVTNNVLNYIFDKYSNNTETVVGIEIVNEPLGPKLSMYKLKDFTLTSYDNLDQRNNMVMHDLFQSIGYWNDFIINPYNNRSESLDNTVLDHHHYEVFSNSQLNGSIYDHISSVYNYGKSINESEYGKVVSLVGEWSLLLTDCVYWLNGVGRGARFDATYENEDYINSCRNVQDYSKWSEEYRNETRMFIELQIQGYELTYGWIFWTWKTENTIDWDLKRLVELDLFPQPLDNFTYDLSEYLEDKLDNEDEDEKIEFTTSKSGGFQIGPSVLMGLFSLLIAVL